MNKELSLEKLKKLNHSLAGTNRKYLYKCKKCGIEVYEMFKYKFINSSGYAVDIPSCKEYTAIKNMNEALE